MAFVPVSRDAAARFKLDGKPISEYDTHSLKARADARGLPRTVQEDESVLRVLLAALLAAGGAEQAGAARGAGQVVSSGILSWADVRKDAQAYLLAAIKRYNDSAVPSFVCGQKGPCVVDGAITPFAGM